MNGLQWVGPALALTTFTAIGIGHILVRRLYPVLGTRAAPLFWLLGLGTYYASLQSMNDLVSSVLGVVAITLVWDGIEFLRQKKRVERGEA
jgi:uncharacterized membrane protein YccC